MEREPDLKPVYIYLVPKSKWPKPAKVHTVRFNWHTIDYSDSGKPLGIEILGAHSVEIDGREV